MPLIYGILLCSSTVSNTVVGENKCDAKGSVAPRLCFFPPREAYVIVVFQLQNVLRRSREENVQWKALTLLLSPGDLEPKKYTKLPTKIVGKPEYRQKIM